MAQVVLDNINPTVFEKIRALAQKHNHSLEDEIKAIIEKVAETEVLDNISSRADFREKLKQARLAHGARVFSDSVELLREDRSR